MKNTTDFFSVRSRIRSFYYAFRGIRSAFRSEHNLWIHTLAAVTAIVLGIVLKISHADWFAIVIAITGVFVSELFNSAVESMVDLISPDYNEKAGRIKDIAAGAVLTAAAGAVVIGLIIFLPKLL